MTNYPGGGGVALGRRMLAERRLSGHLKGILLEAKATEGTSITIRLISLAKLAHEARGAGKIPAMTVNFTYGKGRPHPDGAWVMLRETDFKALTEEDDSHEKR